MSDGIFILSSGSCPRVGTLGHWGVQGGQKFIFLKHGHVVYQIDGDDEQNRLVKFSSSGQTGDLWVRSKGLISLNFGYHVNFKDFYAKLCVFSQIKCRKHIEKKHSVVEFMPQGGHGVLGEGVKKLAWGFAKAPHRLRFLVLICIS